MIGFLSCDALDSGDQVTMATRLTHSNKLDAGDGAGAGDLAIYLPPQQAL